MLEKVFNRFFSQRQVVIKQFIKFCLVGFSNLLIDFSVYFITTRFFNFSIILANTCSFVLAVSWSFWLNKKWTFGNDSQNHHQQYYKFFVINILGMVWQTTILYCLVSYAGWYDLIAKGFAVVLVTFWNFGLSRYWVFGKN
ncbi:MAG: GtrA family protein [Candidatus Buchananbacteria bacterium]